MKKIDLNTAAEEFEMIDSEKHLFYNIGTGEFGFYNDFMEEEDTEKFEDDVWIAAPRQRDIGEYDIMEDFAETISDSYKNELLSVALEGRGAFRRFKDTLHRVGLTDEWYAFKRKAYVEIAREWCNDNGIEYSDNAETCESEPPQMYEHTNSEPLTIAVTMATLESHNHIVGDIERGVKVYKGGGVEFEEREPNLYWARVPHSRGSKFVSIAFTHDGGDIKGHSCDCTLDYRNPPICRHVVAAVLAIQGGIVDSELTLGKTASASTTVTDNNTAKAVGSGDLAVFATPMMVALMERAACECLADCLGEGQTSVGSFINIEHTAASPIGAKITAKATIESVFGRKIEFAVTVRDNSGEIGKGKHTRMIVDSERFMKNVEG